MTLFIISVCSVYSRSVMSLYHHIQPLSLSSVLANFTMFVENRDSVRRVFNLYVDFLNKRFNSQIMEEIMESIIVLCLQKNVKGCVLVTQTIQSLAVHQTNNKSNIYYYYRFIIWMHHVFLLTRVKVNVFQIT